MPSRRVVPEILPRRQPMWNQVPPGHAALSTIATAVRVITLLVLMASNRLKAHVVTVIALIAANLVAILVLTMPANTSIRASILGAITGFLPMGLTTFK